MGSKFKEVDVHGNVYKGDVLHGKRHGQGILLYAETGDVYQGDFENGLPHGSGKYIRGGKVEGNKDGIFEGLWDHGHLTAVKKGKAKIVMENGDVYDGGFNHWKRHGQGKLVEYNGAIYKGQWKEGLRHGFGKQFYPDGYMFEGQFKDDKPVKDGTHKEAFSVIMNSDSIDLNPLDTRHSGNGPSIEKVTKGIPRPRQRSRSRSNKRSSPIFPGRERRDESHQPKQAVPQHAYDMNIPPRSPSRKTSNPIEMHQNGKDDIPRTISFLSFAEQRDADDDPLEFDDDTGFIGVEYQVPSNMHGKQDNPLNGFPRNRSGFSKNHKSDIISRDNSKPRQKNWQKGVSQDGKAAGSTTSNSRKGFGFLRPLSRKRSKPKENITDMVPNTPNQPEMFVNDYQQAYQTGSMPFTEVHDVFGGEEASGLTPPRFRHTRGDDYLVQHSMSSNVKVRSQSPMPRSSSRQSNPYHHIPAVSQEYLEPTRPRSMSRPDSRHQQPPRSPTRTSKTHTNSNNNNNNMQRGRSAPRSRSRSKSNSRAQQRLSTSRGRSRDPQWTKRTTSKGMTIEKKSPSPVTRIRQGLPRENQKRAPTPSSHMNEYPRGNIDMVYDERQARSQSRARDRERDIAFDSSYKEHAFTRNSSNTHTQSIQSKKSQYSDIHMVKSISNKGNSGTLGILALNASSSEDSDYFVK